MGNNVLKYDKRFHREVKMWVYEEILNGEKLTNIINTRHENVKYLPGYKLPENVIACSDLVESVKDATLLIFVTPHQFAEGICNTIKNKIVKNARGVSLMKGIEIGENGMILLSKSISDFLGIDVSVLMGANIANEVADEQFCESTLGYNDETAAEIWKILFHTHYFRISSVNDVAGVELCGALKNVIALAAGFCDGLKQGQNSKAAIIRLGLIEMKRFCTTFYSGIKSETFLESCGVADVITSCFGGRNRRVAEACVLTGKSVQELEIELLNGQKLQGPLTAKEIHSELVKRNLVHEFPIFNAVYQICYENFEPANFLKLI